MTRATIGNGAAANGVSDRRRKCVKIISKLGIASGLVSLLAAVTIYGFEDSIHQAIASESAQNQKLFRLKQIDEYVYHTNLKYATLQKLCRVYSYNELLIC